VKNAKLEYQNSTLRLSDIRSQTEAAVLQNFRKFEDALEFAEAGRRESFAGNRKM